MVIMLRRESGTQTGRALATRCTVFLRFWSVLEPWACGRGRPLEALWPLVALWPGHPAAWPAAEVPCRGLPDMPCRSILFFCKACDAGAQHSRLFTPRTALPLPSPPPLRRRHLSTMPGHVLTPVDTTAAGWKHGSG